jgi:acyl-CoA reductase-like NAD-dependent aldehyde dehydrogenase
MGKPILQSLAEVDKSITHIDYYIKNSERFLADEELQLNSGHNGLIVHQPLGTILGKSAIQIILLSYPSVELADLACF